MSHFGMSFKEASEEISYQNIVLLSASVPRYKKKTSKDVEKNNKPVELFDILSSQLESK